jgi:hypothetical protein
MLLKQYALTVGKPIVAIALDDDGKTVFTGRIEYADGDRLGIRRDDSGDVQEWPGELVRLEQGEERQ